MKAEINPTVQQFKAAYKQQTGMMPIPSNGVHAIAQRGRFFRVGVRDVEQGSQRPQSVHYWMPHVPDFAGMFVGLDGGTVFEVGDWAHNLFGKLAPAKAHEGEATFERLPFERAKRILPYEYVTMDVDTSTGYRLVCYGAYNAMGLIGSECNGIALLDNERKEVVADEIYKSSSGWGGPSPKQQFNFILLARLMLEDKAGFAAVMNNAVATNRLRTEVRA